VTGRRKSFAVDLKGLRRVQLASWRNLILTFRTLDLIRQFVRQSRLIAWFNRLIVRCTSLGGLDLILRQAYIKALVFDSWSFKTVVWF